MFSGRYTYSALPFPPPLCNPQIALPIFCPLFLQLALVPLSSRIKPLLEVRLPPPVRKTIRLEHRLANDGMRKASLSGKPPLPNLSTFLGSD